MCLLSCTLSLNDFEQIVHSNTLSEDLACSFSLDAGTACVGTSFDVLSELFSSQTETSVVTVS